MKSFYKFNLFIILYKIIFNGNEKLRFINKEKNTYHQKPVNRFKKYLIFNNLIPVNIKFTGF